MASAETRFWPGYENDLYAKSEWKEFIGDENPGLGDVDLDAETERLWAICYTRLQDQHTVPWTTVMGWSQLPGTMVAMISSRRTNVDMLKPA